MRRNRSVAAIALIAFSLAGCGESSPSASVTPAWVLASEPTGAVSVTDAKSEAIEGATIVVRGRIGGRKEPLSQESSVFTIVDLELPHCGELEGDTCSTPWDYCCETPEDIRGNSATVQLVDANGRVFEISPTAGGLEPLDEIVVVGRVGSRPTGDVLTILASGVYRP